MPPDAESVDAGDLAHSSFRWEFVTAMSRENYERWIREQLPAFTARPQPSGRILLVRQVGGDVQQISVEAIPEGSKLRVRVRYIFY